MPHNGLETLNSLALPPTFIKWPGNEVKCTNALLKALDFTEPKKVRLSTIPEFQQFQFQNCIYENAVCCSHPARMKTFHIDLTTPQLH